jgi:hypothetical protein
VVFTNYDASGFHTKCTLLILQDMKFIEYEIVVKEIKNEEAIQKVHGRTAG